MVDRPVITSEDLTVGDRVVPRARAGWWPGIGDALLRRSAADVLPSYGVGWVVVYPDDPAAPQARPVRTPPGLGLPELTLYAVPGADAAAGARHLASAHRDHGGPARPSPGARIGRGRAARRAALGASGTPAMPLLQSRQPSQKET